MPASYSYPGIYVQELPSSSHAIIPAPTSIAAFVGYSHPFQTPQFNVAQECFSFNDYVIHFGALFSSGLVDASLPRAVYQFFLNGGSSAWVLGLQPGLFDGNGNIIDRLGAANGGLTISASTGGGPSAEFAFEISGATVAPTISSISPTSVTAAGSTFQLTVNGSGFLSTATVNWDGSPLTTSFVSASVLTANVPAADIGAAGTASVTVSNPAPGGTSAAATFTINGADLAPTISSLSPSAAPQNNGRR